MNDPQAQGHPPEQPPHAFHPPEPPPEPVVELHPLEVHMARLRAELQRTQLLLSVSAAAAVLAALACLYVARGVVPRPGGAR